MLLAAAANACGTAGTSYVLADDAELDAQLRDGASTDAASVDAGSIDSAIGDGNLGALDSGADAGIDSGVDSGPPPGPLSASYIDYDINHVLVTGQSNSVSNSGVPVLSTTQPFGNLMFNSGVMPMANCDGNGCTQYQTPNAFVPLVEGDNYFNYSVETPLAGIANQASFLATQLFEFGVRPNYPAQHNLLISLHGRSGNTYWCLRKGGCSYQLQPPRSKNSPFAQGMLEVQSGKALALANGKTYVVRAVMAIHGESDHYGYAENRAEFPLNGTDGVANKIADYSDAMLEWQADYQSSIQAITGQAQPVPLMISGLSGWVTTPTSRLANLQLDAHVRSAGKVLLVGPGYALEMSTADCLHYTSHGVRRLGEYFAKVYAQVVLGGKVWEPVRPRSITRAGADITIAYHVPRPPLVFDTTQVAAIADRGYVASVNGANVAIANVVLSAPDAVTITLAAVPAGNVRISYAQNQNINPATRCVGPRSGARGNLRDSDTTPSHYANAGGIKYPLENWGVMFDLPVP
jgi:hypothetical protein